MNDDDLKMIKGLWPKLDKNGKRFFLALARAAADRHKEMMTDKDARRLDRFFSMSADRRTTCKAVTLLVALGYLPEGFKLDKAPKVRTRKGEKKS